MAPAFQTRYRVGQDVMASCGKCKQRTWHVVFAMEGDIVRRVQCKICLSYHQYRGGDEEVDTTPAAAASTGARRRNADGELVAEKPAKAPRVARAPKAPSEGGRSRKPAEPDWEEQWEVAMRGRDLTQPISYLPAARFEAENVVAHPVFGMGLVLRVDPERKMEVLFRDGKKILVCNRG